MSKINVDSTLAEVAAIAWNDAHSRDQAILVARCQPIDWIVLKDWFVNEGEPAEEFERFRASVSIDKPNRVSSNNYRNATGRGSN